MEFEPAEGESLYRLLAGAVVPRPIAWVSTTSADGVDNLAPYSFFTVVSTSDPPVIAFAPGDRPDGHTDTAQNILDTEAFVVNIVAGVRNGPNEATATAQRLAEAMNETSATVPAGESEFDHAGVERAPSTHVSPPRVAASPVCFECELYDFQSIGTGNLVLGEVVAVHVDDALLTDDGKLDSTRLDAVGRLAGSHYTWTRDTFSLQRPR